MSKTCRCSLPITPVSCWRGEIKLFVGNAKGYIRLNLAMPHAVLETGLVRMAEAVKKHNNTK